MIRFFPVLSIFVFLFTVSALAATADLHKDFPEQSEFQFLLPESEQNARILVYPEQGFYRVDKIAFPDGLLPERLDRQRFVSIQDALNFVERKFPQAKLRMQKEIQAETAVEFRTEARNVLWTAQNEWSWEWEVRYSEWLATLTKTYLHDNNIATDCADVAYAYRWIFARMNSLPAGNRLAGSNILFTNESMRRSWRNLPTHSDWRQDQRFRAALDYLLDLTYTHSLFRDMYPIAIDPNAFIGGTVHLGLSGQSGHTQVVTQTNYSDDTKMPLEGMMSTVPRAVRVLAETNFTFIGVSKPNETAFLRHRWIEQNNGSWRLRTATAMPNFSEEQFAEDFQGEESSFTLALLKRLNPNFQPRVRVESGMQTILDQINERKAVVTDGYAFCSQNDCSPGTVAYENWSTPSRDKRLRNTVREILAYAVSVAGVDPSVMELWTGFLSSEAEVLSEQTKVAKILFANESKLMSYDPSDSEELRWSVKLEPLVARIHTFIEKGFTERAARIRAGQDSEDIDRLYLRMLYTHTRSYCGQMTTAECEAFDAALKSGQFSFAGETRSLYDWISRIPAMKSDTNSTRAERWGDLEDWNYLNLSPASGAVMVGSDYLWVAGTNRSEIYRLQTGSDPQPVAIPDGLTIKSASNFAPLFYGHKDGNSVIFHLETGNIWEFSGQHTENEYGYWMPDGVFYFQKSDQSLPQVYSVDANGVQLLREFSIPDSNAVPTVMLKQQFGLFVFQYKKDGIFHGEVYSTRDLQNPMYQMQRSSSSEAEQISLNIVERLNGRFLLKLTRYNCSGNSCSDGAEYLQLDPTTRNVRTVFDPSVSYFYRISFGQGSDVVLLHRQQGSYLVELSDDYQILRTIEFWQGGYAFYNYLDLGTGYFTVAVNGDFSNQVRYFYSPATGLQGRRYNGSEGIVGGIGRYMTIWSNTTEGSQVRDFHTDELYLEGRNIYLLRSSESEVWASVGNLDLSSDGSDSYIRRSLFSSTDQFSEPLFIFDSVYLEAMASRWINGDIRTPDDLNELRERSSAFKLLRIYPDTIILLYPKSQ